MLVAHAHSGGGRLPAEHPPEATSNFPMLQRHLSHKFPLTHGCCNTGTSASYHFARLTPHLDPIRPVSMQSPQVHCADPVPHKTAGLHTAMSVFPVMTDLSDLPTLENQNSNYESPRRTHIQQNLKQGFGYRWFVWKVTPGVTNGQGDRIGGKPMGDLQSPMPLWVTSSTCWSRVETV